MWKLWLLCCLCVAMAPNANCKNTASSVCKDSTGFNCLYTTNKQEMVNVPVYFDQTLPSWLKGTLARNGVGQFEVGSQKVTHVFDGFAKLSSWKFFPNGTTVFSTRFVQSAFYKRSRSSNKIAAFILFSARQPPFNIFEKGVCLLNGIDNMNVNIIDFPNKKGKPSFGVLSDTWALYQVSISDLSTIKAVKPKLKGRFDLFRIKTGSSAHPLPEPGTTNRLTFLVQEKMFFFLKNRLNLVRMTSITGRSVVAEWKISSTIPYMHSFSVTQSKAIMLAGPYTPKTKCILQTLTPIKCLTWDKRKPSILYIADFKTRARYAIKTKALFVLHHINAYELNRYNIVMDVVAYDTPEVVTSLLMLKVARNSFERTRAYEVPKNRRLHINLKTKKVTIEEMNDRNIVYDGIDMPAINENYRSVKYCYVYGVASFTDNKRFDASGILKKNMCKGGKIEGVFNVPSHYVVEPVFVPNPAASTEDDGVLLVPLLRGEDAVTYLAVVNAKTMTLMSKADTPSFVPFSLHGHFYENIY